MEIKLWKYKNNTFIVHNNWRDCSYVSTKVNAFCTQCHFSLFHDDTFKSLPKKAANKHTNIKRKKHVWKESGWKPQSIRDSKGSVYIYLYDYLTIKLSLFASLLPSDDPSVMHLHDRWLKDCTFYREIYEQIDDVSLMPRIDWGPVFSKKQVSLITQSEDLPDNNVRDASNSSVPQITILDDVTNTRPILYTSCNTITLNSNTFNQQTVVLLSV